MADLRPLPLRVALWLLMFLCSGAAWAASPWPELHMRKPAPPGNEIMCADWAFRVPLVTPSRCMRAGLVAAEQRSVQGRRIYIRDMPNPLGSIRVLVVGGMHGDELSSTALALQWIAQAQSTGSNVHWRFIPMLNPDGIFAKPSRRTNAHGVDLNRNFPTPNWKSEAAFYWEHRTRRDPRRWPGPQPLSEPESRYLNA